MHLQTIGQFKVIIAIGFLLSSVTQAYAQSQRFEALVESYPNLLPTTPEGQFRADIDVPGIRHDSLQRLAEAWNELEPPQKRYLIQQREQKYREIRVVLRSVELNAHPDRTRQIRFRILSNDGSGESQHNSPENLHVYPLSRVREFIRNAAGIEEYSTIYVPRGRPGQIQYQTFNQRLPSLFGEVPYSTRVESYAIEDSIVSIDLSFASEQFGPEMGMSQHWLIGLTPSLQASLSRTSFDAVVARWQRAVEVNSASLGIAQDEVLVPANGLVRRVGDLGTLHRELEDALSSMIQRPPEPWGRQVLIIVVDQRLLRSLAADSIALRAIRDMIFDYKGKCMKRSNNGSRALLELQWFPVPDSHYVKSPKVVDDVLWCLCDGRRSNGPRAGNVVYGKNVFQNTERQIADYLFSQIFVYTIDWDTSYDGSIVARLQLRLFRTEGWSSGQWRRSENLPLGSVKGLDVFYSPQGVRPNGHDFFVINNETSAPIQEARVSVGRSYRATEDRELFELSYCLIDSSSDRTYQVLRYNISLSTEFRVLETAQRLLARPWPTSQSSELPLQSMLLLHGERTFEGPDVYDNPLACLSNRASQIVDMPIDSEIGSTGVTNGPAEAGPNEVRRFQLVPSVRAFSFYSMGHEDGIPQVLGKIGLRSELVAERWGQDGRVGALGWILAFAYTLTSALISLAVVGSMRADGKLKRLSELVCGENPYVMVMGVVIFVIGPLLLFIVELHLLPEIGLGSWGVFAFIMGIIILLVISIALNFILSKLRQNLRELMSRLIASVLLLITSLRVIQYASYDLLSFWSPTANGLMGFGILLLAFTTLFLHKDVVERRIG